MELVVIIISLCAAAVTALGAGDDRGPSGPRAARSLAAVRVTWRDEHAR